jgi:hypothetical protein
MNQRKQQASTSKASLQEGAKRPGILGIPRLAFLGFVLLFIGGPALVFPASVAFSLRSQRASTFVRAELSGVEWIDGWKWTDPTTAQANDRITHDGKKFSVRIWLYQSLNRVAIITEFTLIGVDSVRSEYLTTSCGISRARMYA